jgi:DNA-binding transcriptional LysR family regulator
MNRTTRRLSMTETGRAFYERSVQILADIEEAEQRAGQMTTMPQGVLRVTIPLSCGQHWLASPIGAYTQAYLFRPMGSPVKNFLRPSLIQWACRPCAILC